MSETSDEKRNFWGFTESELRERDEKRKRAFSPIFDLLDEYTALCESHGIDPERTAETYYRMKHLGDVGTSLVFRMFSPILGDEYRNAVLKQTGDYQYEVVNLDEPESVTP